MYFASIFQELDGAYTPSTLHAYRKDIRRIGDWLKSQGHDVDNLTHQALVNYLENGCHNLKMATIRRSLAALSTILRYAEIDDPTKHPKVRLAIRRLARQRGSHQSQAKPLTKGYLNELLDLCDPTTTIGLRNQVLLMLGYETMRRRSELVAFRFDDLRTSASGAPGLFLRTSKTDQLGHGKVLPITNDLYQLLDKWLSVAGEGRILRSIKPGGHLAESLTPESVNRILKQLEKRLGNKQQLSGHSFRVGRTIDMIEEGRTLSQVALRGGWVSEKTVFRYAQSWGAST